MVKAIIPDQKAKARNARYRAAHREEIKARAKHWMGSHREHIRAEHKLWIQAHPDQAKAYKKRWRERNWEKEKEEKRRQYKANPEKARIWVQTRRARKAGAPGRFTEEQIKALYEQQKGRCANLACKKKLRKDLKDVHRDHRIPLSKGGTNHIDNIDLLCAQCNRRKHAKSQETWARENGLLF